MKKVTVIAITCVFLVAGLMVFCQSAHAGYFKHRQIRQQRRIYNGVRNGSINCWELKRLEREQYRIAREKRRMLADGYFTSREKFRLERHMDRASWHIYKAKHNRW